MGVPLSESPPSVDLSSADPEDSVVALAPNAELPNTLLGASLGVVWNKEGVLSVPPNTFVEAAGLSELAPNTNALLAGGANAEGVEEPPMLKLGGVDVPNAPNGDVPCPIFLGGLPKVNGEEGFAVAAGKAEVPKALLAGCESFVAAKGLGAGGEAVGLKSKMLGLISLAVDDIGFLGVPNPANEVGGTGGASLLVEGSVDLGFEVVEDSSNSFWILERRDWYFSKKDDTSTKGSLSTPFEILDSNDTLSPRRSV